MWLWKGPCHPERGHLSTVCFCILLLLLFRRLVYLEKIFDEHLNIELATQLIYQVQHLTALVYVEGPTAPPSALYFTLHNIFVN